MKFTKMHGIGNDHIHVNCFAENLPVAERPALAVKLADRRFGVGGDGLICVEASKTADFKMDMYNADGSRGLMCGNGIRCLGKQVYDEGLTDKTELTIETASGLRKLWLNAQDGAVKSVRVDMNSPSFDAIRQKVEAAGRTWELTALSVGNPHAVIFAAEDVDSLDLQKIGPAIQRLPMFPEGVNVEFVNVLGPARLKMRVWERGSGETLACGTGATAALAAANVCGHTGDSAVIQLRGGELFVEWDKTKNRLYMTGAAVTVFKGEI